MIWFFIGIAALVYLYRLKRRQPNNPSPKKFGKWKIILIGFGVIVVAGALGDHTPTSEPRPLLTPSKETESVTGALNSRNESLFIVMAQEAIEQRLKDPDSAQFKGVFYHHNASERTHMVCGSVNAKNSFGAYKGYERFVSDGRQVHVLESDMKSGLEFAKVWNKLCRN